MIDIENSIFNQIALALRDKFNGIYVVGEIVDTPAKYPAVTIVETSNTVDPNYIDSGAIENAVNLMYTVNVYSNLTNGKKQQAKAIRDLINAQFDEIGFTRTFCQPIENLSDTKIYRITMRFECKCDDNEFIYRR